MSQRYSGNQTHAPYEHPSSQAPASLSGPPPNALAQQTFSSAQTLPPILPGGYGPTNGMQAYTSRNPAVMMMAPQGEAVNQASLSNSHYAPIYAPTSNMYFNVNYNNNDAATYVPTSQRQQQTEPSRPPPNYMQSNPQAQPAFTATTRSLPEIAPMPPRMNGAQMAIYAGNDNSHPAEQPPPSHVVGAQGRRGILPCTVGRPAAVVGADLDTSKNIPLPRDEDGKYPCPHCEKTYLHSKHLKRHLLRRMFISLFHLS